MLDFLASVIPHSILPALQIIANSSLPTINIPATLTPMIGTAAQTDNTSLVTSIGAIATSIFGLYQNNKDDNKSDKRTDTLANAQLSSVDSLKATDQANKDHAEFIAMTLDALSKHPDIAKILNDPANGKGGKSVMELAQENQQEWVQSFKQYYDSKPIDPNTYSKDPVIAKVATVQQITQPTPSH